MSEQGKSQISGIDANIGVAVGTLVTLGAVLLIGPDNEDTLGLAVIPDLVVTFAVYNILWERAKRRARRDQ